MAEVPEVGSGIGNLFQRLSQTDPSEKTEYEYWTDDELERFYYETEQQDEYKEIFFVH